MALACATTYVDDLSRVHIAAFEKPETPGASHFYNLGTGRPTCARDYRCSRSRDWPQSTSYRRRPSRGDPPALYADSSKAQDELGWEIKFTEVKDIIETAWRWHQAKPEGFSD